ncbi:helix-turn-helix domain-containing protein [Metabacillus halosaccharovorans]|uniref:helix-turn-helix domain-containing protein n=1 Tax=Metabacillus halosaccharovorans TaxID=930124 RepID=UPI0020426D4C|nr:helix-turn-helix domain-containing protein [Metabacillus halosaccharovorans]MCM3439422.1 helix-turn-helix domain-containing protein [Metabacillus halosaccharovorans]
MLKRAFSSFHFRSLFLKISICLCTLVVVPIIFVCAFGNYYSQKVIQKEVDMSSLQMLDQTRRLMDNQLNDIDSFSVQLANSDAVNEAVEMKMVDQQILYRVQYYLRDFYISSPYIDSIYIYYKNINMVQSAITGLQPIKEFEQKDLLPVFEKMEKKRQWFFSESFNESVNKKTNETSSKVTLIRPIPLTGKENNGAIIVNLNQQVLFQSPSAQIMRDGEEIWMIHPSGNYGFDTRQGKSLTSNDLTELSIPKGNEMNSFRAQFRGELYSFTSVTSPHTGWKYIYLVPTKTLYSFSDVIKWFMILIAAISIIVSIGIAIVLAKRMYNPIQSLIGMIHSKLDGINDKGQLKEKGELPFIFSAIEQFSQKEKSLEDQIQKTYPIIRQNYINQLIYEKTDLDDDRLSKLKNLGIEFTSFGNFVCILRIDNYAEFKKVNQTKDQTLIRYFIQHASEEVVSNHFNVISVNTESSDIVLICNLKEETDVKELYVELPKILNGANQQIMYYTNLSVTIGIGNFVSTIGDVGASYQEALKSLELKAYKGHGSIVTSWNYSTNTKINTTIFNKRKEIEENIYRALKGADFKRVVDELEGFFTFLRKFESYPYSLIQHTVLEFLTTMEQKKLEFGCKQTFMQDFSLLYKKVVEFETLKQLEKWTNHYMSELISSLEKELKQETPDITEQIMDYIEVNYNKEISLNGIADKLSLDPAYISRLFKQKVGMNFMEYLISLRLSSAKELLKNGTLTVKEIGQLIGYENPHSFIRIFKKYEGITPGKYREKIIQKQLDIKEIY